MSKISMEEYKDPSNIRNDYLEWLKKKIKIEKYNNEDYSLLFLQLYNHAYVWSIPEDSSRSENGKELRREFVEEIGAGLEEYDSLGYPSNVLEVLVAMSLYCDKDVIDLSENDTNVFWIMMENLDLLRYSDQNQRPVEKQIDEINIILEKFLYRKYLRNGSEGGAFPIAGFRRNMVKLPLWQQLMNYLSVKYLQNME